MFGRFERLLFAPFFISVFLLVGFLESAEAQEPNVNISWVFPVERVDGVVLLVNEIISTKVYCDALELVNVMAPVNDVDVFLRGGSHDCYAIVIATADNQQNGAVASERSLTVAVVVPVKLSPPKSVTGFGGSYTG